MHSTDMGEIRLGSLPAETREALTRLRGQWLEFAPEKEALVVRHIDPSGCPAMAAVPCELVRFLDAVPSELHRAIPGGMLYVEGREGQLMRMSVDQGEIRVQWALKDYSRPIPVPVETVLREVDGVKARVDGWVRLPEPSVAGLQAFVDGFEGLYPSGELKAEEEEGAVRVRFVGVNVGPEELLAELRELAQPFEGVEADLDVSSFVHGSVAGHCRLRIRNGQVEAVRPSLWRD
jgi:hypothetical protein